MSTNEIILRSYDLVIKKIKNKKGEESRVVQLKSAMAFDEGFIADCEEKGVKEYLERDENGEPIE